MNLEAWFTIYRKLCSDLHIDTKSDFMSSVTLSRLLGGRSSASVLDGFRKRRFEVIGNAPEINLKGICSDSVIIVADSALPRVLDAGLFPHIIVTDLDGDPEGAVECSRKGAVIVVHAHGDNVNLLRQYVPILSGSIVGSTQNYPLKNIYNFFGFTDGDRAAFLANFLNASSITLRGFDFQNARSGHESAERKRQKLKWAEYLLSLLNSEMGGGLQFR
ncbi:MAG TPA: 6-hydroxymethylpterin diphosphokinase MptE-like protein [Thermoplasmataceae archaeon]|nr:DUF115 domain-containing protein [Thermoplasmatales archaeon AK]HLH85824.1 6-hydroxymethylpterin diphosphokinase MptE-like protein [Thermoplasmataceae archaeon]